VFTPTGPVLVDPDNGGIEPRLFDLALAVLLFHTECPGAPGRLFTPGEWTVFLEAYGAHIELTAQERELWPAALDQVLWDEGSWALQDNDEAAWADPRQGAFLRDLVTTTPSRFPLG
jgi:Ser/Thr protein kinase RdoA (MazF antagonist)